MATPLRIDVGRAYSNVTHSEMLFAIDKYFGGHIELCCPIYASELKMDL